jgi:hypothetical protein
VTRSVCWISRDEGREGNPGKPTKAVSNSPASHERGRSFIVDGDKVIDRHTGQEPDPETLRKNKAGERIGPLDSVRVVVDPPLRD